MVNQEKNKAVDSHDGSVHAVKKTVLTFARKCLQDKPTSRD